MVSLAGALLWASCGDITSPLNQGSRVMIGSLGEKLVDPAGSVPMYVPPKLCATCRPSSFASSSLDCGTLPATATPTTPVSLIKNALPRFDQLESSSTVKGAFG